MPINLHLGCSLEAMKTMEDNTYDLAVVDPPYGINIVKSMDKDRKGSSMYRHSWDDHGVSKRWDSDISPPEYFQELKRVSRNQIIWGGNYFLDYLGNTKCFLVWNKMNGTNPMADCELAHTTLDSPVRMFSMHHFSQGYGKKIHPTQKPVALYSWIFDRFTKPGMKILDTHLGSGSIALAAHDHNLDLDAWEIDPDYHQAALDRLNQHQRQVRLF